MLDEHADLDTVRDALQAVSTLRKAGADARTSAVILTQLKLRRRAANKFGEFAGRMLFTEDGLAQASRLDITAHHAGRFRQADVTRITDLGCGIGADSLAFASLGFDVTAVERDEVTAAIAAYNLAPFPNASVQHGSAEDAELTNLDGVFLDPARRTKSRGGTVRLPDANDWQPSLDFAFHTASAANAAGIKLGPAFPHELIPDNAEAQWVSIGGELLECALWFGSARRDATASNDDTSPTGTVRRSALVINTSKDAVHPGSFELTSTSAADDDAPIGELGAWLHEPDPAIIRGRFIGSVARSLAGHMIAEQIAWITTDADTTSPFTQRFRVEEVLPLHTAQLKKALRARGIGRLEIKKRGVDIVPEQLRTQLQLRGDAGATLICTRLGSRRVAILAHRDYLAHRD